MIATLLGGLGLFLLGMVLLTDGLKAAAGDALRDLLSRFTGGPWSAFLSGAALTALVQSSSATIVATIGFVSAGLLTFTQSVGVIFGAAVGTTSTGWLVAFLGLRFGVSSLALPLVGVGALARLFGRGRVAHFGLALAGFGLIFVGIATLQAGMAAAAERIDLSGVSGDRFVGQLLLTATGIAMTVVMQSSSAAVATTLAAVQTEAITLGQALFLVVGQNIGTTVTAVLASLGASLPARRTAVSHILFNVFSGVLAFALLPLIQPWLQLLAARPALGTPGTVALFHTAFTATGALILLPLTGWYADLVTRLVRGEEPVMTRYLDSSVQVVVPVAVEAARRTALEVAGTTIMHVQRELGADDGMPGGSLPEVQETLSRTRAFLAAVRSSPDDRATFERHLSVLHSVDHLERLADALKRPPRYAALAGPEVAGAARMLEPGLLAALAWLGGDQTVNPSNELQRASRAVADLRRTRRPAILESTASGDVDPSLALERLDAMRWVDRLGYHLWRAFDHLCTPEPVQLAGGAFPEEMEIRGS